MPDDHPIVRQTVEDCLTEAMDCDGFLEVLRQYLTHHAGQPAAPGRISVECAAGVAEAWSRLTRGLGVAGVDVGGRCQAPRGAPPLAGEVTRIFQSHQARELHVRLDEPGPGVALISCYTHGGTEATNLDAIEKNLGDAEIVFPRRTTFYGATEIGVREPAGNAITFAQFNR